MQNNIPAVSIIIPMYNAEKYIGDCLDSILAQTFTDFEVIVVDDASTDKSRDIVKTYLPKFNRGGVDKLKLICSEKNSGCPGVPRNKGIRFSRGKYLLFVDSDDGITKTALQEMFKTAEKFNADVLYCEKKYQIEQDEKFTTDTKLLKEVVLGNIKYDLVKEPTLFSNDIGERLKYFLELKFYVVPWSYFVKRDLMAEYDIQFPAIRYGEDNFFTLFIVCRAKNLVRVPHIIYIYRSHNDSLTSGTSVEKEIQRYTAHLCHGVSIINKFAERFKYLKDHPEYRYALFHFLASVHFFHIFPLYAQIPDWQLEPLVMRELDKIEDKTALSAFLFSRMNILNMQLFQMEQIISQKDAQINELKNQLIPKM